jgi:hypothetical protein
MDHCAFADWLQKFVEKFLDLEKGLGGRFREETVTDLTMAAIAALPFGGITTCFPHEPSTGADMAWWFCSPCLKRGFGLLIQAKRLGPAKKSWSTTSYEKLGYRTQAATLVRTANMIPNLRPIYFFYNPGWACTGAAASKVWVDGVSAASGYQIAQIVRLKKRFGRDFQLGKLAHLFVPLTMILCCGRGDPARTARAINIIERQSAIKDGEMFPERERSLETFGKARVGPLPDEIQKLAAGATVPDEALKFPTVIFRPGT